MCFSREIDSTPILYFTSIIRHMTFSVKMIQLILAPTTATSCYWHRMMALNLLPSALSAMLMSWAYTMQMSSSLGQNPGTIKQDVLNSSGSSGLSSWNFPLLQVLRSALSIKEGLYQQIGQMHLVSLTLLMCSRAVTSYQHLQMVSSTWIALQCLRIVEIQMIGSTTTSTSMCLIIS